MKHTIQDLENLVSSKLMAVYNRNLICKQSIKEINVFTSSIILLETLYTDYIVTDIKPEIWFRHSDMYYVKPIGVNDDVYYIRERIHRDIVTIEVFTYTDDYFDDYCECCYTDDDFKEVVFYKEYNYSNITELVNGLIDTKKPIEAIINRLQ